MTTALDTTTTTVGWKDVYRYLIPQDEKPFIHKKGNWTFDVQPAHMTLYVYAFCVGRPTLRFGLTMDDRLHPSYCGLSLDEEYEQEQACRRFLDLYGEHHDQFRELDQDPGGSITLDLPEGETCEVRDMPSGYLCTYSDGTRFVFAWGSVECPCEEAKRQRDIAANPDLAEAVEAAMAAYPNDPELAEAARRGAYDTHCVWTDSEREQELAEEAQRQVELAEARVFGARAMEARRG